MADWGGAGRGALAGGAAGAAFGPWGAAIGAAGGGLLGLLGSGDSGPPANQTPMDPNAFNYRTDSTGQIDMRNRGNAVQGRMGPQVNYQQANADYGQSQAGRNQQQQLIDTMRAQALGQSGPSAAQAQFASNRDAAIAQSMAMANSARGGPMAYAASQRQAMDQAGGMTMQAAQQSAVLRAQEQLSAQQQWAQGIQAQRMMDLQSRGMSAQEAQYQAGLEMQQRGLNDNMQQGYLQGELGIGRQNQQGQSEYQMGNAGHILQGWGIQNQQNQFSANRNDKYIGAGVKALGALKAQSAVAGDDDSSDDDT